MTFGHGGGGFAQGWLKDPPCPYLLDATIAYPNELKLAMLSKAEYTFVWYESRSQSSTADRRAAQRCRLGGAEQGQVLFPAKFPHLTGFTTVLR